ncbi:MAG: UDP-N-acetylmuramate:L-alanyl-gamma-D-glutamyl-meso-diaminopimelate ligase [Succinivibrio sp.]|nr:UDP-N-acetylmuramate:L-alanyl-gamma-D-glutamyl-meso-diaminopimelate ligase [Succinivibrio sp.]
MHIHILGICGTFMGGIAMIARQAGFKVTGSDQNVYPPMSTELTNAGIELIEGFDPAQLDIGADLFIVGNVMKRGMPVIERLLNEHLPYVSGPQWLEEHYLVHKKVLAVAGTHGKTTTSSMLAWILDKCGLNPGFLIGGIPRNFGISARNTDSEYFVIEADEYDCAFFDKRSKFVHYHPQVLIMNNLEYDHADIFDSVRDIQKQFHHLIRTIPGEGQIVMPARDRNLEEVVQMGLWSHLKRVGDAAWLHALKKKSDGSSFEVRRGDTSLGEVNFECTGDYNVQNALMAIETAAAVGITEHSAIQALGSFKLPKRRMELIGEKNGVRVYDDFAHHPTAIAATIHGLREHLDPQDKLIAVFEPRSNTMKMGAIRQALAPALQEADEIFVFAGPGVNWEVEALSGESAKPLKVTRDFEELQRLVVNAATPGSSILVMSNGSFNGVHRKLLERL